MAVDERLRVVQEFGPEHAGELVGWAYAYHPNDTAVIASVAVAQVGPEGATVRYWPGEKGQLLTSESSTRGMDAYYNIDVTALIGDGTLRVSEANGMRHDTKLPYSGPPAMYDGLSKQAKNAYFGRHDGGDLFGRHDGGDWALGAAIPRAIKAGLASAGAANLYTPVYYRLAVTADTDTQVADSGMMDRTQVQVALAQAILDSLNDQAASSNRLRERIDEARTSELPVIAEVEFAQQRRQAHERERTIFEHVGESAFTGMHLYTPTGQGRTGRTWPFMDAGVPNEQHAFGQELDGLRRRDASHALYELEREIRETRGRAEFAGQILAKLVNLGRLEQPEAAEELLI